MKRWHLFLVAVMVISVPLSAQQRNIKAIRITTKDGSTLELYRQSFALVIGVTNYTNGWPRLPNAVRDAREVKIALENSGFIVDLIIDPSADQLEGSIKNFIARRGKGKDDRLLFYFAGHGYTHRFDYGGDMGYIVPADAPLPDADLEGFQTKAISMENFNTYARSINSKHALFIFDSCFSGSIFALARAVPDAISYKTAKPVRQFITAGEADETVPDKSIFKQQFLEALSGEGDSIKDGFLTGTELGEFLQTTVINYSRESQHPQYGKIRDPNLDKGDFVFIVPKPAAPIPSTTVANGTAKRSETNGLAMRKPAEILLLRDQPLLMGLSVDDVTAMLKDKKFFDSGNNNTATGFDNEFVLQNNGQIVYDRKSGLMWQRGGSENSMTYEAAKTWVEQLNLADHDDWRLPTLEEAMSLMEPKQLNGDLYIDPKFDKTQRWIWTSDLVKGESRAWVVVFSAGGCYGYDPFNLPNYVRAVRSGQSSHE